MTNTTSHLTMDALLSTQLTSILNNVGQNTNFSETSPIFPFQLFIYPYFYSLLLKLLLKISFILVSQKILDKEPYQEALKELSWLNTLDETGLFPLLNSHWFFPVCPVHPCVSYFCLLLAWQTRCLPESQAYNSMVSRLAILKRGATSANSIHGQSGLTSPEGDTLQTSGISTSEVLDFPHWSASSQFGLDFHLLAH